MGCRVKSGWAAAVVVQGVRSAPLVLDARRLELADPDTPRSYQPYHAGVGRAQADRAAIRRLATLVRRSARRNFGGLISACRRREWRISEVALVVGSTRDPETIPNPHVRAHAAEGRLFREALEGAVRHQGITVTVWREQDLLGAAARALDATPGTLRLRLTKLERPRDTVWRAEQKYAALAAWLLL